WLPQPAFAQATVQILLQLRPAFPVLLDPQQHLPLAPAAGRHRVIEPERDQLRDARHIMMRQVAALMPAEEPIGLRVVIQRLGPSLFAFDQLVQPWIVGRTRPPGAPACSRLIPSGVRKPIRSRIWLIKIHLAPPRSFACAKPATCRRSAAPRSSLAPPRLLRTASL